MTWAVPLVVSLLRYLRHESLDHRLPMPDVPRLRWYVLSPSRLGNTTSANAANTAVGIADIYQFTRPNVLMGNYSTMMNVDTAYYSIALALNALLTLMVIIRLVLHNRHMQNAVGAPAATSGPYKSIVTMLIESFALYSVALIIYIPLDAINSPAVCIFSPLVSATQNRGGFAFSDTLGLSAPSSNRSDK